MTCASCSLVIEDAASALLGLESLQVNFATESAQLVYNENFDLDVFHALLQKLGYRAIDPNELKHHDKSKFFNKNFYQALIAIILSFLTMYFAMIRHNNLIQAIISSLMLFSFGFPYIKAVFIFIRTLHSNMNTLIGLGVLSAYGYSLEILLSTPHAHTYFEGANFIIAFVLLGHFFDDLAKTKARSSLSSLYKMQIKFASKLVEGQIINTPVIDLKMGDLIRLKPGEKFPLDGVVETGESHVDESLITGESQAIFKNKGTKVFAGSLNLEGSVTILVTSTLHDTYISQIVSFVEKAQLKKAPIQNYADKVVKYFVPAIVIFSLITFITWIYFSHNIFASFTHMIAVLVIACPCALGLAVPMVIMLATTKAAEDGLLISGGDVLEKGSHIKTIVFDKTGTLTEGRPKLTKTVIFDGEKSEKYFLEIAASCSQFSNHPLSQTLVNEANKNDLKITDPDKFESLTGLGVVAQYNKQEVLLGNLNLLTQYNVKSILPPNFYAEHIGSYVFMAVDKILVAAFIITDPLKKDAVSLIKNLHKMHFAVWMLTGDHALISHKIAAELGIAKEFVKAEVRPEEKALFIESLQKNNHYVAMIGDGINDAPALAKAHLSIAMGNGSDVALESSEVSILEGKLLKVADFFLISQRSMKIIKENLLLSSAYNLLCIPLAAGIFYPWFKVSLTPIWASLTMGLSSVSVILNSFRVRTRKLP